jgi:hypothetical protein
MKLRTYLSIGIVKQLISIVLQLLIFRILALTMPSSEFDVYILLLGILAVNNSIYSIILNADSVFIIEQKKIGSVALVLLGPFIALILLFCYLGFTVLLFNDSAYLVLLDFNYVFLILLFISWIFEGAINRYLFLLTSQKSWYRLWIIELLKPIVILVALNVGHINSIYAYITLYFIGTCIQFFFVVVWTKFESLNIDFKIQSKRAFGYSLGSVHYSAEKEWFDSGIYMLIPKGYFGSFGVLLQFGSLYKAVNRMLNRFFMKDILLYFKNKNYSKLISISLLYILLLLSLVLIGAILFAFYGSYIFTFMNVETLPLAIVIKFFVLLTIESIANPLTTMMLGINSVYKFNLLLIVLFFLFRITSNWIGSVDDFMTFFITMKLVLSVVGYFFIVKLNNEESHNNLCI